MRNLIDKLSEILDRSGLSLGEDISEKYHADWSGADPCAPPVLLKPKTTNQLSQIMALCFEHDQPVVIQGGLTGLAGGATPLTGELAISLERMQGVESIDPSGMTLTALAGTPLQVLQEAADEHDLSLPLDLGSRGSCQIGGNVSTNGARAFSGCGHRQISAGCREVLANTRWYRRIVSGTGFGIQPRR
jgi:FAD/FMN-containing dehydrogenase